MLQAAQVQVAIDQEEVKKYIHKQLNENIRHELLFIDINGLAEITSCSRRWLEEELLHDPRIRLCERRKNRKRLWLYEDVVEAIKEISEEW